MRRLQSILHEISNPTGRSGGDLCGCLRREVRAAHEMQYNRAPRFLRQDMKLQRQTLDQEALDEEVPCKSRLQAESSGDVN